MASRPDAGEARLQAVPLDEFDGADVRQEGDEHARIHGYVPLSPGTPNASGVGAEHSTVVGPGIEPGNRLPTHRDSAEDLLVVTDGRVEARVGEEAAGPVADPRRQAPQ